MSRSSSSIADPSGHTSSLLNSPVGTSCSAPIHCRGIKKPGLWCTEGFRVKYRILVLMGSPNEQSDSARLDLARSQISARNHRVVCAVVPHLSVELAGSRRDDGRARRRHFPLDYSSLGTALCPRIREALVSLCPRRALVLADGRDSGLGAWRDSLPVPCRRQVRQNRRFSAVCRSQRAFGPRILYQGLKDPSPTVAD